jgi:hypothetical protein
VLAWALRNRQSLTCGLLSGHAGAPAVASGCRRSSPYCLLERLPLLREVRNDITLERDDAGEDAAAVRP